VVGDGQAEGLGGVHIDHKLEGHRLLDGQGRGLRAVEEPVHVVGGAAVQVNPAHAVGRRPPGFDQFRDLVDSRPPVLCRESCNPRSVGRENGTREHEGCVHTPVVGLLEYRLDILETLHVQVGDRWSSLRCSATLCRASIPVVTGGGGRDDVHSRAHRPPATCLRVDGALSSGHSRVFLLAVRDVLPGFANRAARFVPGHVVVPTLPVPP
jgi:hypothetical protein